MPAFYETRMGKSFYEGTMPDIAHSLNNIAHQLEALNENISRLGITQTIISKEVPK